MLRRARVSAMIPATMSTPATPMSDVVSAPVCARSLLSCAGGGTSPESEVGTVTDGVGAGVVGSGAGVVGTGPGLDGSGVGTVADGVGAGVVGSGAGVVGTGPGADGSGVGVGLGVGHGSTLVSMAVP